MSYLFDTGNIKHFARVPSLVINPILSDAKKI